MKNMFMKKVNIFKRNTRNNKGSGLVTVIIAMMFLFSITSSLIVLTYSGFTMKTSQRQGNEVSADATTAMDQIRVGLQNVVSDCIKEAYTKSLVDYSYSSLSVQKAFAQYYRDALYSYKIDNGVPGGISLFRKSGDKYEYSVDALNTIVNPGTDSEIKLSTPGAAVVQYLDVEENKLEGKIILKNVTVTATAPNGKNISIVTADIAIGIPNIGTKLSQLSMAGVPEFAIIAGNDVIHNCNTTAKINGCVTGNNFKLGSMTALELISKVALFRGEVSVSGNWQTGLDPLPRISTTDETVFWADTITIHAKSWAKMMGTTLVANDLDLRGFESKASLGGAYYGFGDDKEVAGKSSAILANGRDAVLDLTELQELTLSGFAFIHDDNSKQSGYVQKDALMGESISVRENQRVYLIPVEDLQYREVSDGGRPTGDFKNFNTNPEVFGSPSGYTSVYPSLKSSKYLWTVDERPYTYASYGASVQTMGMPYGNQSVAYYFLKFSDTPDTNRTAEDNANLYFKHYFMKHPEEISGYIQTYISVIDSAEESFSSKSVGNMFANNDSTSMPYKILEALSSNSADTINITSSLYNTMYKAACTSLKYDVFDERYNPFTYYILAEDNQYLTSLTQNVKYNLNGANQVLLVNGDLSIQKESGVDPYKDIGIIIATGNVTVNDDFEGCIMCGGDLILNGGSVTASERGFEIAYKWLQDNNATFNGETKSYAQLLFRNSPIEEDEWANAGKDAELTDLVTFENWIKE